MSSELLLKGPFGVGMVHRLADVAWTSNLDSYQGRPEPDLAASNVLLLPAHMRCVDEKKRWGLS